MSDSDVVCCHPLVPVSAAQRYRMRHVSSACRAIIDSVPSTAFLADTTRRTCAASCNMSFGEDAAFGLENRGQFVSMLRDEVIKKRNVIFVTSAGNSGERAERPLTALIHALPARQAHRLRQTDQADASRSWRQDPP